jgi:hypothetical protein
MSEDKRMTWTRWAVIVQANDPRAIHDTIWRAQLSSDRFHIRDTGVMDGEVRLVVEYTAAGANSDDVKRRLGKAGIPRHLITTVKIASIDRTYACNEDLVVPPAVPPSLAAAQG